MAQAEKAQNGRAILVLDPLLDPEWNADFITADPEKFLQVVWANRSCSLYIDEAAINQHDDLMTKVATRSRHFGHKATFICQRAKMVNPTVRSQCSELVLFKQALADTEDLAREFVEEAVNKAHTFGQGDFVYICNGRPPVFGNVFKL